MQPADRTTARPTSRIPWDCLLDIMIATRTLVPVLISGTPDRALLVAMMIAERSRNGNRGPVTVLPAARAELIPTIHGAGPGHGSCQIIVLREIEALTRRQQVQMIEMIQAGYRAAARPGWRLITTTSVSLVNRVGAGGFEPSLFYLLNAIHIMV